MKQDSDRQKPNTEQIASHLKSAVDALIPDVFDRIDLSAPQDVVVPEPDSYSHVIRLQRRMRGLVLATAACLCLVLTGGGAYHYQYQNRQVDSIIGLDVNPSVELSINRKNRVLSAEALNADAEQILADMDLEGTDLNVAVNAVIGSMVTNGYLNDLDNAILVTVSNDSIRKASELRTSIVGDIERTLEENQVQAAIYDQQVIEKDEMKELADAYGISYGKAYFLQELIEQNQELTMEDMEELSSMTMEEIAARIADNALALGEFADRTRETTAAPTTAATEPETTTEAVTEEASTEETTAESESATAATTAPTEAPTTEEAPEEVEEGLVEIDYADYEDGMVYVYFVTRVKWKNPTVSIRDEEGNSYAAYVEETDKDSCTISVSGLEGGKTYTFVLGGLTPREGGSATTVKGYFEKPEIAGELDESEDEDDTEPESGEGDGTDAVETTSDAGDESSGEATEPESTSPAEPDTQMTSEEETPQETEASAEESTEAPEPETQTTGES